MSTTTIRNIKSTLAKLQECLPQFRQYLKDNYTETLNEGQWGNEREYTPNGLVAGIQSLITDISCLVDNPKYFIRLSTYSERDYIHNRLSYIASYVKDNNPSSVISDLEGLKQLLRPYNLRTDKKRMIAFQQSIDELTRKSELLTQVLEEIRNKEGEINQISNNISKQAESVSEKEESIETLLKQSEEANEELDALKADLEEIAEEIRTLHSTCLDAKTEVCGYRDEVKEFVEEMADHQKRIEKQSAEFETFRETLDKNTEEQGKYLEDAFELIEQSKKALQYTTSVGLGASFDAQCKELKGWNSIKLWSWLVASAVSVIGVISIGVWLIGGGHNTINGDVTSMWMQIIGKISMIPLLVTATIFCAGQYSKQKALLEDYSYKLTLAKSMVAFSEELREKDPERHREYLSMVLSEILQDPLRHRVDPNVKENSGGFEKKLDSVRKLLESLAKVSKDVSNP
jgi:hypothetical protein